MLSARPWRADALIRLFASVLICVVLLSATATSALQFIARPGDHSIGFVLALSGALFLLLASLFTLRRQWPLEKFGRKLFWFLMTVYLGLFLLWLSSRLYSGPERVELTTTARVLIAVLCFHGAALLLVHFFVREHKVTWAEAFGLQTDFSRAVALGLAAGLVALPTLQGIQVISGFLLDWSGIPVQDQEAVRILKTSQGWANRAVLGVTAILIAPVAEEVLFRGILYPGLKQAGYPRAALWISAVVFGAIHVNLAAFVPLTLFALALVWLYEKTGNLVAPILAHTVFNAANFVMLFLIERLPMQR